MLEMTQKAKTRLLIINIIIYSFSLLMFFRLFYLQIIKGKDYYRESESNKLQPIRIPAYRSVLLDRTMNNKLAYNRKSLSIIVIPANLPKEEDKKEQVLSNLSLVINMPLDKIKLTLEELALDKYTPVILKYDIDSKTLVRLAEHSDLYPGVLWDNRPRRVYPSREKASHVIGYTGIISKEELEKMKEHREYHSGTILGKKGIEKYYDEIIRGQEGIKQRTVDAVGTVMWETNVTEAVPGPPLVLTIHKQLQDYAYELMAEQNYKGAVVISKPATGEILTLVSTPGFDPNVFTDRFSEEEFFLLKNDINKPFLDRALQGTYPPASTFKLVTASAYLNAGNPSQVHYNCPGYTFIGKRKFGCWSVHHNVSFIDAIARSCDVFFYSIGIHSSLGRERIMQMARLYGLNVKSQIDLPNEKTGLLPEMDWFKKTHKRPWSLGDTANISIGQGDLLVTPLGLNVMTATIVNDGTVYKPFLLKNKLDPLNRKIVWTKSPEVLRKITMSKENFEMVKEGMHQVLEYGTASWLKYLTDVPMGGKTGTGQAGLTKDDHALFTAYAPYGDPNLDNVIAVTVVVEHGGHGSSAAAPVAAKLIDFYFKDIMGMSFKKKQTGK